MDDCEKRPGTEDRHVYWALDLGLTKPFRDGDARQRIAIRVDGLEPRADSLKFDCTIRVPLKSLQVEGGYQNYELLHAPQHRVHMKREKLPGQHSLPPLPSLTTAQHNAVHHITFCQYGDRLITSGGVRDIGERIKECGARIPNIDDQEHRLPPDDLGLSQTQKDQLAKLMNPQIFAPIYQSIAEMNASVENVEVPRRRQDRRHRGSEFEPGQGDDRRRVPLSHARGLSR